MHFIFLRKKVNIIICNIYCLFLYHLFFFFFFFNLFNSIAQECVRFLGVTKFTHIITVLEDAGECNEIVFEIDDDVAYLLSSGSCLLAR